MLVFTVPAKGGGFTIGGSAVHIERAPEGAVKVAIDADKSIPIKRFNAKTGPKDLGPEPKTPGRTFARTK